MGTNNLSNKFMQVLNEVPNFVTDETAQAGNRTYKYLNLATILKTIKPVFEKYGLAFSQRVTFDNTGETRQVIGTVETIIFDDTDQMVVCSYPFFVTGDPQQVGSAIVSTQCWASSPTRTTTERMPSSVTRPQTVRSAPNSTPIWSRLWMRTISHPRSAETSSTAL